MKKREHYRVAEITKTDGTTEFKVQTRFMWLWTIPTFWINERCYEYEESYEPFINTIEEGQKYIEKKLALAIPTTPKIKSIKYH